MQTLQLTAETIEELKEKDFLSVIIYGASNPEELRDADAPHLMASKEAVTEERTTQTSFVVAIDDPVLLEIIKNQDLFIEIA